MIAILLSTCLFATAADSIPMSVDRDRVDLGTVKAGPALSAKFQIQHTGTAGTLVITGVQTGCGCLKTSASRLTLTPGESTELSVEINSLTQAEGANSWRIVVHAKLELPGQPQATVGTRSLVVTAKLEREIVVTPPMIAISTTGEASQTITMTDKRPGSAIKVTQAATTSPHLIAAIQPNGTVTVTLATTAPSDGKTYSEIVTLATADPAYPSFRIPVTVVKRSTAVLSVTPDRLMIRFATGETAKSGVVQLRNPNGTPLTISSATCSHAGISLTHSLGSNPVAALRATVDLSKAGESGEAEAVVTLSSGQTVSVPLSWIGKP